MQIKLCVVPLIKARIIQACAVSLGNCAELKEPKQAIRKSAEDRIRISESAKISRICDPSARDIYDKDDIVFSLVAQMKTQIATASVNSQLPSTSTAAGSSIDESAAPVYKKLKLLKTLKMSHTASENDYQKVLEDEVHRYAAHVPSEEEADKPLMFLKQNAHLYPHIAVLAREYLGIPCGSVPVECMFSITGLILNIKGTQLNPLNLNMITFINNNLRKVDIQEDQENQAKDKKY